MIDVRRLAGWMDDPGLPGQGKPVEHRFVSGGTQNEIYEISRGGLHCAMRIPPPSAPAGRDAGILREWRIIEALTGTGVPCPEAVARCADTSVLGRPFYLMGFRWKFAIVLEQGYQRAGDDVKLRAFGPVVLELMRGAAELAESTEYRPGRPRAKPG